MDTLTLRVGDLSLMESYYSRALALTPVAGSAQESAGEVVLGRAGRGVVRLVHTPGLPTPSRSQAGLFHTAMLLPDEATLAATVLAASQDPRSRFVGSSDHHVSEAFYFTDPEGNGVELYTDRPRSSWVRSGDQIAMTTTYLDPNAYLQRHLTEDALGAGPSLAGAVGHVHLQVGDLATARAFYVDALGFETTQTEYPGAIFASAGGYHHHIAMNVWNSQGAGPRAAALGLGDVSITVPDLANLDTLAARLRARTIPFDADGRSVTVSDPWGTRVTVALPDLSTEELLSR